MPAGCIRNAGLYVSLSEPMTPAAIVRREGVPPLPGPKTDVLPREIERQERPARIVPEQ